MRNTLLLMPWIWLFSVWGITFYAIFWLDRSAWWIALAILLSDVSSNDKTDSKDNESNDQTPEGK